MKEWKVCAVVPTYNRKELVTECLECILAQTYPVESIVLIDNVSTDGTHEYLEQKGLLVNSKIEYTRLPPPNKGSAGSYYEGMKRAQDKDVDFVWLMDDDTFPKETCLEKLLEANEIVEAAGEKAAWFKSATYNPNGIGCNAWPNEKSDNDGFQNCCYRHIDKGLIEAWQASWLSLLITKEALIRCGSSCAPFYMDQEDFEYTIRLVKFFAKGYFVPASRAIHKKTAPTRNEGFLELTEKSKLFRCGLVLRNSKVIYKKYDNRKTWKMLVRDFLTCIKLFGKPLMFQKIACIIKADISFLLNYKKFSHFIDNELEQGKKAWEEQYGKQV